MRKIDLGCGNAPKPDCDVYVDYDLDKGKSRYYKYMDIPSEGEFIQHDLNNKLPFKDKEFDYAYCSHVLEHIENLEQAIQEISRIAKAGEIAVPSYVQEYMINKTYHIWLTHLVGDTIVFMRKEKKDEGVFRDYFVRNNYERHNDLRALSTTFQSFTYKWKDKINAVIIR